MKIRVTMTLDEEVLETLDAVAKKLKMNRSKLAENIFMMGLSDVKILKDLRLIDLAYVVTQVREYLKKGGESGKLQTVLK